MCSGWRAKARCAAIDFSIAARLMNQEQVDERVRGHSINLAFVCVFFFNVLLF